MKHAISLACSLAALWLVLSGYLTKPLLVGLGLVSVAGVVAIALRMDVVDHEGHPIHLRFLKVCGYWLWLLGQIARASLDVARRILTPGLPISPRVVRVRPSQHTELGQVIYANSITLTPGTVSINLEGGAIEVHALTREAAEALEAGEMDRRVAALEVRE